MNKAEQTTIAQDIEGWREANAQRGMRAYKNCVKIYDRRGYDCKLIGGRVIGIRNRTTGLWSATIWNCIPCTILAKSYSGLKRLVDKLMERLHQANNQKNKHTWIPYYKAMKRRRYRRWFCKQPDECQCELCRKA